MKKELLTKEKIVSDLLAVEKGRLWRRAEGLLEAAGCLLMIATTLCVIFQNAWIALPFGVAFFVFIALFLRQMSIRRARCDRVKAGDFTVGRSNYAQESKERVFEPHLCGRRFLLYSTVKFWHFSNGKWRAWCPSRHYAWSDLYAMSQRGLENVTLVGDEFYTVALLGDSDFGYVYPTKLFQYDERA